MISTLFRMGSAMELVPLGNGDGKKARFEAESGVDAQEE